MLKKRLIFTLLYMDGSFFLSRNFRLQKVGSRQWLLDNYNFQKTAKSIDELIILDVSRDKRDLDSFLHCVADITRNCFVPIALGGGIRDLTHAESLIRQGADKLVLNTSLMSCPSLVLELISNFGSQSIIASVDYKYDGTNNRVPYISYGQEKLDLCLSKYLEYISSLGVGEILLNSIDRDGTGQGLDIDLIGAVPPFLSQPIILSGGAGNGSHLLEGIKHPSVDAVATANLFNFIDTGLSEARQYLIDFKVPMAVW